MNTISGTQRVFARGTLLAAMEKGSLLTGIEIGRHGTLACQTEEWSAYWRAATRLRSRPISDALSGFRSIWRRYVESGFRQELQREYCFGYHVLLDKIASFRRDASCALLREALHRCLAFECFGVSMAENPGALLVAGTSTTRNPNYLLAKVKYPNALDDVRFLPLVTAGGGADSPIFYHYRRHRLSPDSDTSLLLYLPADMDARARGFRCISELERLMGEGKDARVDERAKRLAEKIIVPFLDARTDSDTCTTQTLELLDLGAGSGALAAAVCKRIHRRFRYAGGNLGFKVRLVDLVLPQPRCFWSSKTLGESTDFVYTATGDSQGWVARHVSLLPEEEVRIALVSQLFNNQSEFQIRPLRGESLVASGTGPRTAARWRDCLPSRCLGISQTGPGNLRISTTPLRLAEGRTFLQPSLSAYFQGIRPFTETQSDVLQSTASPETAFACFRRFRPECLATHDGASILRSLLDVCSLVLVFDADLSPCDLKTHFESMGSEDVVAIDMTQTLRLKGNYCYVLMKADEPGAAGLTGDRLW